MTRSVALAPQTAPMMRDWPRDAMVRLIEVLDVDPRGQPQARGIVPDRPTPGARVRVQVDGRWRWGTVEARGPHAPTSVTYVRLW